MGLDTVYLLTAVEEAFGIEIPEAAAQRMRTPRDMGDFVCERLGVRSGGDCRTRRTFHRVRRALCSAYGLPRGAVRPATPLAPLLDSQNAVARWTMLGQAFGRGWPEAGRKDAVRELVASLLGEPRPPRYGTDRGVETVADAVRNVAAYEPDVRPRPGQPWTRERVMLMLRRCTLEETRVRGFRDDQEYVRDMGME
jgi:hypothetical protein